MWWHSRCSPAAPYWYAHQISALAICQNSGNALRLKAGRRYSFCTSLQESYASGASTQWASAKNTDDWSLLTLLCQTSPQYRALYRFLPRNPHIAAAHTLLPQKYISARKIHRLIHYKIDDIYRAVCYHKLFMTPQSTRSAPFCRFQVSGNVPRKAVPQAYHISQSVPVLSEGKWYKQRYLKEILFRLDNFPVYIHHIAHGLKGVEGYAKRKQKSKLARIWYIFKECQNAEIAKQRKSMTATLFFCPFPCIPFWSACPSPPCGFYDGILLL